MEIPQQLQLLENLGKDKDHAKKGQGQEKGFKELSKNISG
jgi:hypothetical protein